MTLKGKRERFVQEYLIDLNAAAAYRRAGYTAKNDHVAAASASKLLTNADVAAAIVEAQRSREERVRFNADRVLAELAHVALSDIRRLFDEQGGMKTVKDWDDGTAAAVSSVEVFEEYEGQGENRRLVGQTRKVRLWDKVGALGKAGQHMGMFKDRVELTGKNGGPVEHAENAKDAPDWSKLTTEELLALREMRRRACANGA